MLKIFYLASDDSTPESYEFTLVNFILTKGKNILPILTSHCKNKQTSSLHFHNTQNGIVFCLMELKLSPQLFQLM